MTAHILFPRFETIFPIIKLIANPSTSAQTSYNAIKATKNPKSPAVDAPIRIFDAVPLSELDAEAAVVLAALSVEEDPAAVVADVVAEARYAEMQPSRQSV